MDRHPLPDKLYHYLLHLLDTGTYKQQHQILENSRVFIKEVYITSNRSVNYLELHVDPEIYKWYQSRIDDYAYDIGTKLQQFSDLSIENSKCLPDLSKFSFLNNRITPVETPWSEINTTQNRLLEDLRNAKTTIDHQNIGNSCRMIILKLADLVFNPDKHTPINLKIDLGRERYKNRLHSFILEELGNHSNDLLKEFAISAISTCEKSIDLANKKTHDFNASSLASELCVISTVTVIQIINLIKP